MYKCKANKEIDRKSDLLLITGDGKTLPSDLKKFLSLNYNHEVLCLGRSHKIYPKVIQHYADVDADAGKWVAENIHKTNKRAFGTIKHTLGKVAWFDVGWEIEDCPVKSDEILWHGSSALFAVLIGLAMGYRRIVLAGCPLDSKGHWYFPDQTEGPRWTAEGYQSWFEFATTMDARKVRSMSGYTRQILGNIDDFFLIGIDDYAI